ncbi:DUF4239 domain-containing protein [Microbacterium hatanonis]|uniref:DUF4239 domain-containing protein n=2 Tax=Microbacterium hatanonis TaxID=404366 RepID=A0A5C8HW59_9MICO|nr:DUF4239 domain-containing protein [Microbacterium hatanonis]
MWLYDLPIAVGLPLFVLVVVGGSLGILLLLRRWVRRMAQEDIEWDRVLGYAVGAYGVFYGVTLGLIAAGAYGNLVEVDDAVLSESSSIAVMYRSADQFPEPVSSELQAALIDYTEKVVELDWPLQQRLIVPETTDAEVGIIQDAILSLEPTTTTETTLQAQTLVVFNDFVAERRQRLALTSLALPGVLWIVLAVGAVLNAVLIGLIQVTNLRIHLLMAGLIALFVSLLLYAVAGFDHAYAGPVAVEPIYFQDLIDGLFIQVP